MIAGHLQQDMCVKCYLLQQRFLKLSVLLQIVWTYKSATQQAMKEEPEPGTKDLINLLSENRKKYGYC